MLKKVGFAKNHPDIAIYYYFCQSMSENTESDDAFTKMLSLTNNPDIICLLSKEEVNNIHILLSNYYIRQINKGKQAEYYRRKYFEINENYLKQQTFSNKPINEFIFCNCFKTLLMLKKYDQAENFLDKYKCHLDIGCRNDLYNFCKGNLQYEIKSYTAAIKTLFRSNLENSYLLYHLDKENILMKSHYCELNGSEKEERFLNSHIRHFKKFLKNDCKNIQKNIIALHNNS